MYDLYLLGFLDLLVDDLVYLLLRMIYIYTITCQTAKVRYLYYNSLHIDEKVYSHIKQQ